MNKLLLTENNIILYFRRLFGNFNVLSVGFLPGFLSCLVAIFIERPARRGILSLYTIKIVSHSHILCLVPSYTYNK